MFKFVSDNLIASVQASMGGVYGVCFDTFNFNQFGTFGSSGIVKVCIFYSLLFYSLFYSFQYILFSR